MSPDIEQLIKAQGEIRLLSVKKTPVNFDLSYFNSARLSDCDFAETKTLKAPPHKLELERAVNLLGDLDFSATKTVEGEVVDFSKAKSIKWPSDSLELGRAILPNELDLSNTRFVHLVKLDLSNIKKAKWPRGVASFHSIKALPAELDLSNTDSAQFVLCDLSKTRVKWPKELSIATGVKLPAELDWSDVKYVSTWGNFDGAQKIIWPKNGKVDIEFGVKEIPAHIKKSYEAWKLQQATKAIETKAKDATQTNQQDLASVVMQQQQIDK